MELELKHLAAYLPYGVKVVHTNWFENCESEIVNIECICDEYVTFSGNAVDWYFDNEENECEFKLILRPLSDITKEIEHNGEKFVPIDEYNGRYLGDRLEECINASTSDLKYAQFHVIEQLLEWHFDIFGLIDNNLAIDINTLNK